jgi:hypothetical protein
MVAGVLTRVDSLRIARHPVVRPGISARRADRASDQSSYYWVGHIVSTCEPIALAFCAPNLRYRNLVSDPCAYQQPGDNRESCATKSHVGVQWLPNVDSRDSRHGERLRAP